MKSLYKKLSLLLLVFTASCGAQNKEEIKEVVFNAHTRGRSESITVVNYNVFLKTHQTSKTFFINTENRKKLEDEIAKINLKSISNLKAPSSKRLFDGAMHTVISIKIGDKNYVSSTFDDNNPPIELKDLVVLLRSFIQ